MALNLGQTKFLQPLRSNTIHSTIKDAVEDIEALKSELSTTNRSDGTSVVARYRLSDGEPIKTVLGIFTNTTSGNGFTYFVLDKDQSDALINRVEELETSIGEGGSVSQQITDALSSLTADLTNGELVHVTVKQENGKITSVTVDDSALDNKIGELETAIGAAESAAKAAATKITEDTEGHVTVSVVTNADTGALTYTIGEQDIASASELDTLKGRVDTIANDYLTEADKTELEKLVTESVESYSIKKVTENLLANVKEQYVLVKTTTTISEDGTETETSLDITEPINIYKDSSLREVKLNGQSLDFTYILADGSNSTVGVDVSTFLAESEFKDGLQVINGVVSVKIDETNNAEDNFLKVTSGGVYTEGISDAISAAESAAKGHADGLNTAMDTRVKELESAIGQGGSVSAQITEAIANLDVEDVEVEGSYVTHVTQTDGIVTGHKKVLPSATFSKNANAYPEHEPKIIYNIQQSNGALTHVTIQAQDIASTNDITTLENTISGINNTVTAMTADTTYVKAVTVNNVNATVENNKATVTIDGSNINLSTNYVAAEYSSEAVAEDGSALFTPAATNSTLDVAISQVDKNVATLVSEVLKNEKTTSAAITAHNDAAGFDENGKYVVNTAATYINAATSLSEADTLLDSAVKGNADSITAINETIETIQNNISSITSSAISVKAGNGIAVTNGTSNASEKTISAVANLNDTLIEVTENGIGIKEQGYIDCGTF